MTRAWASSMVAARDRCGAAKPVEVLPRRVRDEVLERRSGPVAEVDLVEGKVDVDPEPVPGGDRLGGLARPFAGAGEHRKDRPLGEPVGQRLGLGTPRPVKRMPGQTAGEHPPQQIVAGVPDQVERGCTRHAPDQADASPRMNASVSACAAWSVTCVGGLFIK